MHRDNNYFTKINKHFLKNIYTRPKGQIRLAVLKNDLYPLLSQSSLNVLDLGCGAGNLASWMAQYARHLTLVDNSATLLGEAKKMLKNMERDKGHITYHCQDIHDFAIDHAVHGYDLICCHAVIEWIEDAQWLIALCRQLLNEKGVLSLMFYNQSALAFIQHVFGNFEYVEQNYQNHHAAKLTPTYPRTMAEMTELLSAENFTIINRSGVRCFYDYMKPKDRQRNDVEEIISKELSLSQCPEYFSVSRYIHYMCRINDEKNEHLS